MQLPLWERVAMVTKLALQRGSLQTLETHSEQLTEGDLQFQLRQLSSLKNKSQASANPMNHNPFLPHEEDLFVDLQPPHHKLLLNKFNVLERHLLLVTEQFEEQTNLLTLEDFQALYHCMNEAEVLAFYNSGELAGASQQHKHLQIVLLANKSHIPFFPQLAELHDSVPRHLESLPFTHAALALPAELFNPEATSEAEGAQQLHQLYERLRITLGIEHQGAEVEQPYNLILTQRWMLMVPRREESFAGISLNALAFIGSILVQNEDQARQIKTAGLANALNTVSGFI